MDRLIAPGEAEPLAEEMRRALTAPARLKAEAMLRRERVKQKFSLPATAGRIEEIYREALEARYSVERAGAVTEVDTVR